MEPNNSNEQQQVVTPNTQPQIEPNLPVEPQEEPQKQEEQLDPEYAKWLEETKDLPTAFKRYKDSSSEGKKRAEEAEKAIQAQNQLTQELQTIFARNPELAEAIQKEISGETANVPTKTTEQYAQLSPEDKALLQGIYARENSAAQMEINSFREGYKDYIKTDSDWEHVKSIAAAFDGKVDRNGRPYTLRTALEAAVVATHPEVIGDKAVMERMASIKQRDSAADFGSMPSGGSQDTPSLTAEEASLLETFKRYGATEQGYLSRKAQDLQN